ncbi:MAG: hypothetical protein R3B09_04620 [Nannocystaceae bacterium]
MSIDPGSTTTTTTTTTSAGSEEAVADDHRLRILDTSPTTTGDGASAATAIVDLGEARDDGPNNGPGQARTAECTANAWAAT